jgi:WD40 repeat protein/transcriptional regulator with XRE-family HTH domain
MNQPEVSFGHIVREHRRALGLTQAELALRVACATVTIRKIEYGTLRPSHQIAERLAMALNIPKQERATFVRLARTATLADRSPPPLPTPPPTPEEIGYEDLSGRAIRGYELGERLGTGGFGVVYRAVQPLIERDVAIKIILPKYADHPDFIRRFEAEAQRVARLEHPYIVPLYDYWREPGVAYLVMRLLRGGCLVDRLKEGPLPLEVVAMLLEQIGAALHAAHRFGVIHRDLKPANVLLDEDGNGYLADFGIAKDLGDPEVEDPTQSAAIVGSPAYSSPEQIRAEPVKPQADIYGLGVLLYEMLSGSKPFLGPTPIDYIQQHLNEPLPPLVAQPALDPVIRRATAKDPRERYGDVPSLLVDFRQAIAATGHAAVVVPEVPYAVVVPAEDLENPYKGLRAFGEADAADFFGREMLVQELLGAMAEADDEQPSGSQQELARFLAVVGPSGSGKSSVVQAGLIPALRQGGLPGSQKWFVVDLQPGAHPFEELEAALLRVAAHKPPKSLLALLQEGEWGLLRAVRRVLPGDPEVELVLVIDQFEELFTQVADEQVRARLLDCLVAAVLDPRSRLRVVVTLRADFMGRALEYVDFGELLRQRTVFVLPLTAEELEEAIVRPVARVGVAVETGLVATIVQDVGDQPGMLPLLQYALTELFERSAGARQRSAGSPVPPLLTLAAYQQSGGVTGALGRRAEEIYGALGKVEQEAARQLFLRLVALGEGASNELALPDTRRRVLRAELEALVNLTPSPRPPRVPTNATAATSLPLSNASEAGARGWEGGRGVGVRSVLNLYGRHRLLTFDHDPLTRGPTVEVAHEALLREWGRLHGWLEGSRADLRLQRLLAAAAAEWEGAGREPSYLLRGARLAQFEGWAEGSAVALTGAERAFLEASVAAREEREAEEKERQRHELEQAQKLAQTEKARAEEEKARAEVERLRAEEQTTNAIRLRRRALWLAGAAVVAVVLAALALWFGQQASQNAATARSEADVRATAAAVALNEADRRATQQAVAEEQRAIAEEEADARATQQAIAETEAAARAAAEAEALANLNRSEAQRLAVEASQLLLKGMDPQVAALLALRSLQHEYSPQGDAALEAAARQIYPLGTFTMSGKVAIGALVYSPDGQTLFTANSAGLVQLRDANTGEVLREFSGPSEQYILPAFSPDGRIIATATSHGPVQLWDAATGEELGRLGDPAVAPWDVAFSPDGRTLLSGGADGIARLWDVKSGQKVREFAGHTNWAFAVAFSPDGRTVLTGSWDKTARLWDVQTGELLQTFTGHTDIVVAVAYFPDGQRVLTGSYDKTGRVWDVESGQELQRLEHPGTFRAWGMDISPDGRYVLGLTRDSMMAYLWDAAAGEELRRYQHPYMMFSVAFAPDGQTFATACANSSHWLWETEPRRGRPRFPVMQGSSNSVDFSPDGRVVAVADTDGPARLLDVQSGLELQSFEHADNGVERVAFSPDGRTMLTGGHNELLRLWDIASGQEIRQFTGPVGSTTNALAFLPDGHSILSVHLDDTARIWDVATGEQRLVVELPTAAQYVAISPDGKSFLTGMFGGGSAYMWDTQTGDLLLALSPGAAEGTVFGVAYSPDGRYVTTGCVDNAVYLWDAATGELVRRFVGHANPILNAVFSPDGKTVATAGIDNTVRLWDVETGQELRRLVGHAGFVQDVDFSPDGRFVVSGSTDGTVRLWHVDIDETIAEICGRLLRDLTDAERAQFNISGEGPVCP